MVLLSYGFGSSCTASRKLAKFGPASCRPLRMACNVQCHRQHTVSTCFNMAVSFFTKNTFQADEEVSNDSCSNHELKHFHTMEQHVSSSSTGGMEHVLDQLQKRASRMCFFLRFLNIPCTPLFYSTFSLFFTTMFAESAGKPILREVSCHFSFCVIPSPFLQFYSRRFPFKTHLVTALALEVGAHESSSFVVKERNVPRASRRR